MACAGRQQKMRPSYTAFGSGVSTEMCSLDCTAYFLAGRYTAFGSGVSTEMACLEPGVFQFFRMLHSLRLRGEH